MTDRNNNFTPDGSEKAPGTETRAQRRERLEAEEKAERLRAAEEKKQARIEEKKQAAEEKKQVAEARRKAKEKPPLTAEEKAQKAARAKHIKIAAIVFASIFVLLISAAAIGGYIVTGSDTNYPNVRINGIDVGGLTKEQTLAALDEQSWDDIVDKTLVVTLPAKVSFKVDYVTAGMKLSREQAADAAYSYGRTQGLFGNLFRYLLCCVLPADVDRLDKTINADYLNNRIDSALEQLELLTADKGYKLDKEKKTLTLVKGAGEIDLDREGLYSAISAALTSGQEELSFSTLKTPLKEPDFQAMYKELAVEPVNAYYTETFDVVDEVVGCSFNTDIARKLWENAGIAEEVKIPLEISYPEYTAEELRAVLYRDKLGSQTTLYTWSTSNRINNINLAAETLNGMVLMPGEVFSFNEALGERTEEAGYKSAGAYNDGQVVEAIGGGICQVSSTLYCAVMFANLKTVSRTNHYFKVDYLDYGLDATVSWGKPDYKFSNSRDYPVKIVAYCDNDAKSLTIEIWGTDVDGTQVTLRHTSTPVYDETYTDTLIGYTVYGYRTVSDADGNFLYETAEPGGVYYLHTEDIAWPAEKLNEDDYIDALEQLYRAG